MYVNMSFFEVMSEVQEDLEDVSAGIDKLTSPGIWQVCKRALHFSEICPDGVAT
jgi:hypothetical protein